jgi:hypothetical protein
MSNENWERGGGRIERYPGSHAWLTPLIAGVSAILFVLILFAILSRWDVPIECAALGWLSPDWCW